MPLVWRRLDGLRYESSAISGAQRRLCVLCECLLVPPFACELLIKINIYVLDQPHYHWIYWLGPAIGSGMAVGFFLLLKVSKMGCILPCQRRRKGSDTKSRKVQTFDYTSVVFGQDAAAPEEAAPPVEQGHHHVTVDMSTAQRPISSATSTDGVLHPTHLSTVQSAQTEDMKKSQGVVISPSSTTEGALSDVRSH